MEIDQDIGNESLNQKQNLKPLILLMIVIIGIFLIIGIVLIVLPGLEFHPQEKNNINEPIDLENTPEQVPEQNCTYIASLEPTKQFAILSNGNTTDSTVSLEGPKAEYIMLYDGSNKEFVENPYKDSNEYELLADWLEEKGVIGLVVGSVDNNFIYAIKQNEINCYKSTETIKFLIKETLPKQNYCTTLSKADTSGIVALATNSETQEGIVSLEDYNAPYFQIYDGNTLIKTINNPVVSGGTIDSLMTLLQDNNVSVVLAGTPRDPLKEALQKNEIACVNSTEVISYVINQFK